MILSETCIEQLSTFCTLCGTQNINKELKIVECNHFEGCWGDDEIFLDKSGLVEEAEKKALEIQNQVEELLDKKFPKEKMDEESGGSTKKYHRLLGNAILQCFTEIGFPLEIKWTQVNGIYVSILQVLERQLDDSYVVFVRGCNPWMSNQVMALYHISDEDSIDED